MKKKYDKVNRSPIIGKGTRNLPKTKREKRADRHRLEMPKSITRKAKYLLKSRLSILQDIDMAIKTERTGKRVIRIRIEYTV